MVDLADLWLPILLSAAFVFVVSSVIHMVLQLHKGDYVKLPREAEIMAALRAQSLQPGQYVFPGCESMKDMGSPEFLEKMRQGPVGFLSVRPNGPPAMGKSLMQWFAFSVAISIFVAYAATLSLPAGAAGMDVFRLTGTIAILAYAASAIPDSIWKGIRWGIAAKFVLDGILYGLATGAVFAWLWPSGSI